MASMPQSEPLHSSLQNWSHRNQFPPHLHPMPQQQQQLYQPRQYRPLASHQHHQHRLPSQTSHESLPRQFQTSQSEVMAGTRSVLGRKGIPEPASRPRGPKLKFSAQEDQMLVELKENKNLTWKQISDFFPGRTSGTLQVRYCTKLKAKTVIWTDDTVRKLSKAIEEYENDKWRVIAAKVGSGFSPTSCQEKAEELEIQEEFEDATSSDSQSVTSAPMQSYTTMSLSSDSLPAISASTHPYATMSCRSESQSAVSAPM